MAKKLLGQLKLQIPAGAANPSPPVGPALGQRGINIMEFCKAFNAKTEKMEKGLPLPVVIDYYQDKSFTFIVKTAPASVLLRKAAKLKKGSQEPDTAYSVSDAVKLVKSNATSKFDETVEIAVNLGVDPKYADQMVRGVVSLPSGTGKDVRVAVFARDAKADEAKEAGAEFVGAEDLMEEIQNGKSDFDRVIASPDMMSVVGRLGKILGPRGLMPNPKVGTVTPNVGQAVKDAKGGSVEFRVEKLGIIHAGIGKASFTEDAIEKNVRAFIDALMKAKPSGAKGTYVKKIALSSTMGPGVVVDTGDAIAS
eukprot:g2633.t1